MIGHSRKLKQWTLWLSMALAVLVAVMIFLLWQDTQQAKSQQPATTSVVSMRIQRDAFEDIVMVQNNNVWTIESPCSVAVNEQRLMPLLSALEPGGHQYNASEVDLLVAGLETPLATIHLNDIEHRIGNTDLNGNRRYLQRGNKVEFVPEWVLSLVNGGVTALAKLELFAEPLTDIRLKVDQGSEAVSAQDLLALRPALNELATWQDISAQQIVPWPIEGAPASPSYKLTVTNDEGREQLLSVFETASYIAVKYDSALCAYIMAPDTLPD